MAALNAQGWTVDVASGGHLRFTNPEGQKVFASATPGSQRSWTNTVAELRRHGLDMKSKPARRVEIPLTTVEERASGVVEDIMVDQKKAVEILETTAGRMPMLRKAGLLTAYPQDRSHANYYRMSDLLAFKESSYYLELGVKKRAYTARPTRPRRTRLPDEPLTASRLLGTARVSEVIEALRPVIREEVLNALREYHRERA